VSVKCITALKKGTKEHGENWDTTNRELFQAKDMDDCQATDLIWPTPEEQARATDFYLRDLARGLRKHPNENDGGIFTQCVKYCEQSKAGYKLSNVWKLATDLEAGRPPQRAPTPEADDSMEENSSSHEQSENEEDSVIGEDTEVASQEVA
jgi:hypothetical protein